MDSPKVRKMPCPPETVWAGLASGAMVGAEADSLVAHASECPNCARILRVATDTLSSEGDESEHTEGPEMDWKALATKMAKPHAAQPGRWRRAAVAAVLLLSAGVSVYFLRRPAPPLATLAAAYANPRTLEFRVDGAPHATLHVRRGEENTVSASPELLETQAAILRAMGSGVMDSGWMHAKGRAELLRGNYEEAIRSLEAAAGDTPSASHSIDLGVAYASRAAASGSRNDYDRAVVHFTAALSLEPKNAAALFNRALAHGRLLNLDSAIRDLERCIAEESDVGWRSEAQTLLDKFRKQRAQAFSEPHTLPDTLRFEASFDETLRDGLPPEAVRSLAPLLNRHHGDRWLTAVAAYAGQPGAVANTVATLASMARIRSKSRREEYAALGARIVSLISARLPEPLAAWRDFELLASESNRPDKSACLTREAFPLSLHQRRYRWFAIQAALEVSTCQSALGNLDGAAQATNSALGWAREASYGTASIRAQGFLASHYGNEGRYREAVETSLSALTAILNGEYPLDRAFQFYRNLALTASRLERWESARAAAEMSVAVAHHTGLATLEMLSLITLAEFSLRAGDREASRRQLLAADELAGRMNLDRDSAALRGYSRALVSAVDGDYAGALAAERQILASRNLFLDARYLSILTELELRQNRAAAARDHALEAIRRIASNRDEARRFRDYDARAARSLVRAYILLGDYAAARQAWREWLVRDRDLMGGRRSVLAASSGSTLTIVPLDTDIAVFVETMGGLQFRWAALSARQGLHLVRRLRSLCANYRSDPMEIRDTATRLLSGLVGSDHPVLRQAGLRIETLGEWASIPLLALLDSNATFRLPATEREGCVPPRNELALVHAGTMAPEFRSMLPLLPQMDREAQLLRSMIPSLDLIAGPAATPRILAGAGTRYRWMHYSGHTLRLGQTAVLVAAPDATAGTEEERRGLWRLRPSERMCADLIFFAACSTGVFQDLETIAPAQLADAAILAGVKVALAALWDVDSQATTELAAHFYATLRSGADVAQSLLEASRALRRDLKYRHPYYWAAFVVYES